MKLASEGESDDEEYKENRVIRFAEQRLTATDGVQRRQAERSNGKRVVTPMVIVIIALGTTDLLFALDSIPAIYGLTQEPFLVFTANVFALMGLRQLYFLLGDLLERLVYLSSGCRSCWLHRREAGAARAARERAAVHQRRRALLGAGDPDLRVARLHHLTLGVTTIASLQVPQPLQAGPDRLPEGPLPLAERPRSVAKRPKWQQKLASRRGGRVRVSVGEGGAVVQVGAAAGGTHDQGAGARTTSAMPSSWSPGQPLVQNEETGQRGEGQFQAEQDPEHHASSSAAARTARTSTAAPTTARRSPAP